LFLLPARWKRGEGGTFRKTLLENWKEGEEKSGISLGMFLTPCGILPPPRGRWLFEGETEPSRCCGRWATAERKHPARLRENQLKLF